MSTVTLDVTKEFDCDVLVVGGGCAGIAAAARAAKGGADVILAEQGGYLGGIATAGLVGPFMTSYSVDGKTQLIRGFFDEITLRMEKEGGAVHPSRAGDVNTAYTAYRTAGHKNLTAFNSETLKRVSEQMCRESGVRLMYHMLLVSADVEDGQIKSACFATRNGIYRVNARVFIDCTGDADLARLSGVPTVYGDGNGWVQPASMFFTVRGVDKAAMDAHMHKYDDDTEKRFYMQEIIAEREAGRFPCYRAKIMLFESFDGEWVVNMAQVDDIDGTDPEQVTDAEIFSRVQIQDIIAFLRRFAAGCENITLSKTAPTLGVRETYRVVCDYELSLDDAVNSVKFDDAVMCCASSIDIHQKGGVHYVPRKSDAPYYMPYRSLIAKGAKNLLAAGRCAGASRDVMAAIRVMPPCFAMGEAAGTAAALAVTGGTDVRGVDTGALIAALTANGVYIE